MINTLVSIIVPCYNQAQFLDEALQSVWSQSFDDWECIIINDGSSDDTGRIAKKWIEKDERFKYIYQENKGLSSARNFGIQNSNGEFILPLDADDKISPDYLHLAITAYNEDPSLKIVYCKAEKFGEEVGLLDLKSFTIKSMAIENMIFCTAMYNKREWKKVGGYDPKMLYGLEDWEFWIAILKNGGKVKRLEEVGFYYRIRKNSMLRSMNKEKQREMSDYLSIKHADFFVKHLGSFFELNNQAVIIENHYQIRLRSEKFVIDLFFKTFFGFTLFGKHKK